MAFPPSVEMWKEGGMTSPPALDAATTVWQTFSDVPRAKASSRRPVVRFASAAPDARVGPTRTEKNTEASPPRTSMATATNVMFGEGSEGRGRPKPH